MKDRNLFYIHSLSYKSLIPFQKRETKRHIIIMRSGGDRMLSYSQFLERKNRAFEQRIYLTETIWPNQNVANATFGIQGSTGALYLVNVDATNYLIDCTCPDFKIRGNFCKHCFFVTLRVLRMSFPELTRDMPEIDESNNKLTLPESVGERLLTYLLRQNQRLSEGELRVNDEEERARLASQTVEVFNNQTADQQEPVLITTERKTKKQKVENKPIEKPEVPRKPIEGECAICFEDMDTSKEEVDFCRYSCGQNLHLDCMLKWSNKKRDDDITCPYCRSKWF